MSLVHSFNLSFSKINLEKCVSIFAKILPRRELSCNTSLYFGILRAALRHKFDNKKSKTDTARKTIAISVTNIIIKVKRKMEKHAPLTYSKKCG